jgi:preprotein translocase subunit SecF
VAFSLFLFGGEVLNDFSFILVVGIITGTYSSIYIASAILVEWHQWEEKKKGRR